MKGGDSKAQTQVWLAQCEESYGLAQVKLFHFHRLLLVLEDRCDTEGLLKSNTGHQRAVMDPTLVNARLFHNSCTNKSHLEQFHLKASRRCLTRRPLEVSVIARAWLGTSCSFRLGTSFWAFAFPFRMDLFKARASGLSMTPLILVNPPQNYYRSYIPIAIAVPTNLPPSY